MKRFITIIVALLSAPAALAAEPPSKVLLLPLESSGPAEKAWVAKAVQQNLVAELGRVSSVQAVTADQPAKDLAAAVKVAEAAGAQFVVFGGYQVVDADLRITGQVVDVAKRQSVAGLKATGTLRDLFGMEDTIASQVKRALPAPAVADAGPEMLKQPAANGAMNGGPIAGLDQREPLKINDRAKELEDQIDRAIKRLQNSPVFADSYYPSPWFYSGIYYPPYGYTYGYYPVYGHRHHHYGCGYGGYGLSVSGSYLGRNGAVHFGVGGGSGGVVTGGNYANFGRMSVQPVRR
jgi:TolB-like protein